MLYFLLIFKNELWFLFLEKKYLEGRGNPKMAKFIVFEGIDGCGKSTQAKLFAERLFDSNKLNHVLLTREPYNSEEIRSRLKAEDNPYSNAGLMADLYIEDRKKHLDNLVIPSLERGIYVVSDRYKMSTIAYQTTQGLYMDDLIKRHEGLLVPNITFFIDAPVYIAIKRCKGKDKKFEGNPDFQEKLRVNYFAATRELNSMRENIIFVDGAGSVEEISNWVWELYIKN